MIEQALNSSDIEAAEKLLGITYTADERQQMLDNLEGQIASARLRRSVPLQNSAPMASRFDPRLPGFRMPAAGGRLRIAIPEPGAMPDDERGLPPHESKRIKVMAEYRCDPLWALDEDRYGCFPPEMIALSPELTSDLDAWAAVYDTAFDPDNPADGPWSKEQHRAHSAEGRRLAQRLKRERPDLMIYVLEADTGVVEVHADDG